MCTNTLEKNQASNPEASSPTGEKPHHEIPHPEFTQIFARQLDFKDLNETGQLKLLNTKVGIVGAGGLGSNVAWSLRSCGIGHLVLVDGDKVELSNLPRQMYGLQDVGRSKVACLKELLDAKYDFGQVQAHEVFLNDANIAQYLEGCDVVLDCTDRLSTRLLVGRFTCEAKIPLISASVEGSAGQLLCLDYQGENAPCFEDLVQEPLKDKVESGANPVLGCHVAVMAAMQALETINYLVYGSNVSLNTLVHMNLLTLRMLKLKLGKNN